MPSRDPNTGRFVRGGGGLTISLNLTSRSLRRNVDELPERLDVMVHAVMEYQATKALGFMKTTAPWTDRTGNARNGLGSKVEWKPLEMHAIRLFHRMWYGIFLETRWAGKYAIILPTIQKFGPDTMRVFEKLLRRLGTGGGMP